MLLPNARCWRCCCSSSLLPSQPAAAPEAWEAGGEPPVGPEGAARPRYGPFGGGAAPPCSSPLYSGAVLVSRPLTLCRGHRRRPRARSVSTLGFRWGGTGSCPGPAGWGLGAQPPPRPGLEAGRRGAARRWGSGDLWGAVVESRVRQRVALLPYALPTRRLGWAWDPMGLFWVIRVAPRPTVCSWQGDLVATLDGSNGVTVLPGYGLTMGNKSNETWLLWKVCF